MPKQVAAAGRSVERLGLGVPFEEYPLAVLGMIADMVMPVVPVSKRSAAVSIITRDSLLRRRDVRRQDGGDFSRDEFDIDELTYTCQGYGHEQKVTKAQREVYRTDFDADLYAQGAVERILKQEREIRVAAEMFNVSASYWYSSTSSLYTDVGTDWDDAAAIIIADVEGAKEHVRNNCGLEANTLIVSSAHLKSFKLNTIILSMLQYNTVPTDAAIRQILPALFGIKNVLIGAGMYNASSEGLAGVMTPMWSDDYCWVGVIPETANLTEPGAARTFQWDAFGASGIEWDLYTEKKTKTDIWQGEHWLHESVIDVNFGHVLLIDT